MSGESHVIICEQKLTRFTASAGRCYIVGFNRNNGPLLHAVSLFEPLLSIFLKGAKIPLFLFQITVRNKSQREIPHKCPGSASSFTGMLQCMVQVWILQWCVGLLIENINNNKPCFSLLRRAFIMWGQCNQAGENRTDLAIVSRAALHCKSLLASPKWQSAITLATRHCEITTRCFCLWSCVWMTNPIRYQDFFFYIFFSFDCCAIKVRIVNRSRTSWEIIGTEV